MTKVKETTMETNQQTQTNQSASTNQPTASLVPSNPSQLDPTAVTLAKAIRQQEVGTATPTVKNYQQTGDNGSSFGAYQFNGDNFQTWAKQYGLDPSDTSPVNQDKVAYARIKDLLDQGNAPSEVIARWNGAKMVNGKYVAINQDYANKVKNNYVQLASQYGQGNSQNTPGIGNLPSAAQSPNQTGNASIQNTPNSDSSQSQGQPGLLSQLGGRASDAASNLSDIANQLQGQKGSQGWWSDLLQTGGDVAGGVGDILNAGLKLIPGVSQAENWFGGEVGKAADTQVGQSVVQAIQGFQQAHPELSKDINAGFNIATAIPIFKGLGVVADAATSGLGSALEGMATKGMTDEIMGTAGRTVAGRNALSGLGDDAEKVIQEGIIKPRNIPGIVNGKYDISEALARTDAQRSAIAQNELQPLLDKASTNTVADRMPLQTLRQKALDTATDNLQDESAVNKMFDRIQKKYGDYPTLAELNKAKQLVSDQVPQRAFDLEGYNSNYNVRQTLQKGIEDGANTLGLGDVNAINGKMRLLYQADDLLKSMDGKPVKVGILSKLLRKGTSVGVGMIADKLGGGVIGGLGASYLTDIADKGLQGTGGAFRRWILNRASSEVK
jgi:hypothetical protein